MALPLCLGLLALALWPRPLGLGPSALDPLPWPLGPSTSALTPRPWPLSLGRLALAPLSCPLSPGPSALAPWPWPLGLGPHPRLLWPWTCWPWPLWPDAAAAAPVVERALTAAAIYLRDPLPLLLYSGVEPQLLPLPFKPNSKTAEGDSGLFFRNKRSEYSPKNTKKEVLVLGLDPASLPLPLVLLSLAPCPWPLVLARPLGQ